MNASASASTTSTAMVSNSSTALAATSFRHYFKRNFYKEHPRVEERSWEEIDKFLNLHQIKFSGFDLPKPIFMLDEINFPDYIATELKMQGITRPTAIQSMIWPALYSGRDIMCIGLPCYSRVLSVNTYLENTKFSCLNWPVVLMVNSIHFSLFQQYICPALVFIKEQEFEKRKKGPLVLIVTQTKEVAKEILTHSSMFIYQSQCSFCSLIDDENINTQIALLNERGTLLLFFSLALSLYLFRFESFKKKC